jgi:hypothetical protein
LHAVTDPDSFQFVIKVCPGCASTWAGGTHCEDCGHVLHDPYARDAAEVLPRGIWRYIRLQYGAAGKAVRVWVLRKGQLNKRRMAKALVKRALRVR